MIYEHSELSRRAAGPRIAAIGGGTGLSTMLRGLKKYTDRLTAIVTVADDGGGSGVLRREMGILPPGDVRQCMQALANTEPVMERLLPLDREHLKPAPKGLGDPRGEVEMFPDAWTVFEQTAPIYMHGMIFGAMTESFCAEQSARMTAMDSATKSATDMIHALQLEYNRTRQGAITQEITEIIGGASAVQTSDY